MENQFHQFDDLYKTIQNCTNYTKPYKTIQNYTKLYKTI